MTFKVGAKVKVAKILPGAVSAKLAMLGKTGTIERPSKIGTNQYVQRNRWVLKEIPGYWFDESELELIADSAMVRRLQENIKALELQVQSLQKRVQKAEGRLQQVRQAAVGIIGTVDGLR